MQTRQRHIANALPAHCKRITDTLQTRQRHIANALTTHCKRITGTLENALMTIANTLMTHCTRVNGTFQTRARHITNVIYEKTRISYEETSFLVPSPSRVLCMILGLRASCSM